MTPTHICVYFPHSHSHSHSHVHLPTTLWSVAHKMPVGVNKQSLRSAPPPTIDTKQNAMSNINTLFLLQNDTNQSECLSKWLCLTNILYHMENVSGSQMICYHMKMYVTENSRVTCHNKYLCASRNGLVAHCHMQTQIYQKMVLI